MSCVEQNPRYSLQIRGLMLEDEDVTAANTAPVALQDGRRNTSQQADSANNGHADHGVSWADIVASRKSNVGRNSTNVEANSDG